MGVPKVPTEQFDSLLKRLIKQEPQKSNAIKGTQQKAEAKHPIIPKPSHSAPR